MTILWCGGEDVDFRRVNNSPGVAYVYDATMARCSLGGVLLSIGSAFPEGIVTSLWGTARVATHSSLGAGYLFGVTDYRGYGIWAAKNVDNTGSIYKYNGSWVHLATSSTSVFPGGLMKVDIEVINYGAAATVRMYTGANSNPCATYTGDITISGMTGFDSMSVYGIDTNDRGTVSEFIAANEDTRLMRLKTHYPSAAGDVSNWQGTYADIDEASNSDVDLIYSGTPDAEFQCNINNLPTGKYQVKAVKVAARQNNSTGFGTQLGVKTNSTVSLATAQQAVGTWGTKEVLYQVNPVTGQPFTMDEINALQFAAKHVVV